MRNADRSVTPAEGLPSHRTRSRTPKPEKSEPVMLTTAQDSGGSEISTGEAPRLSLAEWCRKQGITESNARGYYIPQGRIPGVFKIGADWYVPATSVLTRRQGGRPRKA